MPPSQAGRRYGAAAIPRGVAGYTLLEILLALAVAGLLLAALSHGTWFGLFAWRQQGLDLAWTNDAESADRALRAMFRDIRPAAELQGRPPLIGAPETCEIVTMMPIPVEGSSGPAVVRIAVDEAHRLVLRWQPAPHARWLSPLPPPRDAVLMDGVGRIEFAYWNDPAGGWLREWQGPGLPRLIRLRIVFPASDRRHWPDIVVAPLLAWAAGPAPEAAPAHGWQRRGPVAQGRPPAASTQARNAQEHPHPDWAG